MKEERLGKIHQFYNIKELAGKNIEDIAEHRVHITRPAVVQLFNEFGAKYESTITEKIEKVLRNVTRNANTTDGVQESEEGRYHIGLNTEGFCLCKYHEKFWQVPQQFALPTKTKRKRVWELWVCGISFNGDRIHPF